MKFTQRQLDNFAEYVFIQRSGQFNMFDPKARQGTSQTRDEWVFNMQHYSELKKSSEVKE